MVADDTLALIVHRDRIPPGMTVEIVEDVLADDERPDHVRGREQEHEEEQDEASRAPSRKVSGAFILREMSADVDHAGHGYLC